MFSRFFQKFVFPYARAIKYGVLKHRAERRIAPGHHPSGNYDSVSSAFLVGCGRSGTTVIGDILGHLPDVYYLQEPYHLWATINPSVDVLKLFSAEEGVLMVDQKHFMQWARGRYNELMLEPAHRRGARVMLEKTPLNAFRIGYLDKLAPGCKFIHLLRDGTDVARSIENLSVDDTYRIAGKPTLNRWWGCDDSKWNALARDGGRAGYFGDEVDMLSSFAARGAYEWLVTMEEMIRWRQQLGDRLLEMTYAFCATDPGAALRKVGKFLGVNVPDHSVIYATDLMRELRSKDKRDLILPPQMCIRFNELQEQFGFPGRAVPDRASAADRRHRITDH